MIDFHTYPVTIKEFVEREKSLQKGIREVFGLIGDLQPLETFLLRMDVAGMEKAVLLSIDCSTSRGARYSPMSKLRRSVKRVKDS